MHAYQDVAVASLPDGDRPTGAPNFLALVNRLLSTCRNREGSTIAFSFPSAADHHGAGRPCRCEVLPAALVSMSASGRGPIFEPWIDIGVAQELGIPHDLEVVDELLQLPEVSKEHGVDAWRRSSGCERWSSSAAGDRHHQRL